MDLFWRHLGVDSQLARDYSVNIECQTGGHKLKEIKKQDNGCMSVFTQFEPNLRDRMVLSNYFFTRLNEQIATSFPDGVLIKSAVTHSKGDVLWFFVPFTATTKQKEGARVGLYEQTVRIGFVLPVWN